MVLDVVKSKKVGDVSSDPAVITDNWLLSVPKGLLHSEELVVNYLGMLVAIDFQHWCELDTPGRERTHVGQTVETYAGFYVAVAADSKERYVEDIPCERKLIRGSAAMIHLLKEAVEQHDVRWYDMAYLLSLGEDPQVVKDKLAICFQGCAEDGKTPLWMPETLARVEILMTLARNFSERKTSFHGILRHSEGYLFEEESGFIPQLVNLHPRYRDYAVLEDTTTVPVLKLSQLTALSLEQALMAYWRWRSATDGTSPSERKEESFLALAEKEAVSGTAGTTLFKDIHRLSICCDYQIPKVLRAAGLLEYSPTLAQSIDNRVLLGERSSEESSIRVATLVAAELLAEAVAQTWNETHTDAVSTDVVYACLDFPLWYIGRSMKTAEHHLCHTIMY
ncbi:hypothetical protein AGDE_00907 [Angomonas deanei]|uniref:Queuosine 5'-phosphate N-glycosylase/hydrolase n=1 Tax=Angomonas deanei TaxID=59799 RepID=A0A7G2C3X6_9TRYP|nr:hypothetical protein AGDE_00907 [Angomonas deanei]CAD2214289.1 Potential Queuosine, Q, salvage protein family, putative [Angomonas deanei]|eukprot:EPY43016.1 hypothetical protein AGDE_00907 [Angomonas deanei]